MPRSVIEDNERMNLRISASAKAKLARAAALRNTDLTNFVTQTAVREAEAIIEEADSLKVSSLDLARIFELLENPPKPNDRLKAAITALPQTI